MSDLNAVIKNLKQWQKANKGNLSGRCLEACRACLLQEGLRLPAPQPRPSNTALVNFDLLSRSPATYGWKVEHSPLDPNKVYLVYFKRVGILPDGRVAGHISLLKNGIHYSNRNYKFSQYWADRLVGAFSILEV